MKTIGISNVSQLSKRNSCLSQRPWPAKLLQNHVLEMCMCHYDRLSDGKTFIRINYYVIENVHFFSR